MTDLGRHDFERLGRVFARAALEAVDAGQAGQDWRAHMDVNFDPDDDEIQGSVDRAIASYLVDVLLGLSEAAFGYQAGVDQGRQLVELLRQAGYRVEPLRPRSQAGQETRVSQQRGRRLVAR